LRFAAARRDTTLSGQTMAIFNHEYVPRNMPAIGDLFDLFDFGNGQGEGRD
jgi:hypothetical protein